MIKTILGIILKGLDLFTGWQLGYNDKETKEARELNDDKGKIDDFRKDYRKRSIEDIRKDLS